MLKLVSSAGRTVEAAPLPEAARSPEPEAPNGWDALRERVPRGTLHEIDLADMRDAAHTAFPALVLPEADDPRRWLWVQDRMSLHETGRPFGAGLARWGLDPSRLLHVTARDARDALWVMEEALRSRAIHTVIGEVHGAPKVLDFTATRRLAFAAEANDATCVLTRVAGPIESSGARHRWRIASAPSEPGPYDRQAPGVPRWRYELTRSRAGPPGAWTVAAENSASNRSVPNRVTPVPRQQQAAARRGDLARAIGEGRNR